jgi:hypothetical protein
VAVKPSGKRPDRLQGTPVKPPLEPGLTGLPSLIWLLPFLRVNIIQFQFLCHASHKSEYKSAPSNLSLRADFKPLAARLARSESESDKLKQRFLTSLKRLR